MHFLSNTDKPHREIHGLPGHKQGYGKAVDMWAVGSLTVVLLTGALPFVDPRTNEYSQALADECNPEILEHSSEWSEVSALPKDFVGKLLVNESQRLTADDSLQHSWFSNDFHKTDFEELYKRTIRHWQPKIYKKPIIEFMDAHQVKNLECSKGVLASERKIKVCGGQTPIEPPVCVLCCPNFSPTVCQCTIVLRCFAVQTLSETDARSALSATTAAWRTIRDIRTSPRCNPETLDVIKLI